ncbi:MAG: metallophosphoesterase [Chloroflexi bacterium]|nr:metallophosphoesterase [Chloroflexota bacterium]
MRIGVIADTHIPQRLKAIPPQVGEIFHGVDRILHAGDLVDPRILDELERIAPVVAVRGNIHLIDGSIDDPRLPPEQTFELEGHRVLLTHGHGSFVRGSWERLRYWVTGDRGQVNERIVEWYSKVRPGFDVIVFGHSHRAFQRTVCGVYFFNPGAVAPTEGDIASVGLLTLEPGSVRGEIVLLE